MKVVQCSGIQPHFFDIHTYPVCPICGAASDSREEEPVYKGYKAPELSGEDGIETVSYTPPDKIPDDGGGEESLKEKIKEISATGEGKTLSYFGVMTGAGDVQGTSTKCVEPVAGWLVCINGNHFGECFNISAGKNSIGRNETNSIVLKDDNSVSREKHALITYEPKKRNFYIKSGDGSGLTYVNDDYITETRLLLPRDVIEIGNNRFIFVPLCDQSFTWEDYMT